MNTPDYEISFRYISIPMPVKSDGWQVSLVFPPNATAETLLQLRLFDGEEQPLSVNGVFYFLGRRINFVKGKATVKYVEFVTGIHEKDVWFVREGGKPIPGGLTFA